MKNSCSTPKPQSRQVTSLESLDFDPSTLRETGRGQYFYHSPLSDYPIRDVTNKQGYGYKMEPHIEKGAENYYDKCLQSKNIFPFAKGDERYLFLFTNCKMRGKHYRERLIIGYIIKQRAFWRPNRCDEGFHVAVQGDTRLYSFDDALPLAVLGKSQIHGMCKFNCDETRIILEHFKGKRNILAECVDEVNRLERQIA